MIDGKSLTIKQENACLAYVEVGNKSEAYRRAFNATNMKEATINKRANEFFNRGDIKGRVAELRKPVIELVQITLKSHLEKLAELRDKADASEKWQAAITAEVARGKASGLYVEKQDLNITGAIVSTLQEAPKLSKEEWLLSHGLALPK